MVTEARPAVNGERLSNLEWQRKLVQAAREYAGEHHDCAAVMRCDSFNVVDRAEWVATEKTAATSLLEIAAQYPGGVQ